MSNPPIQTPGQRSILDHTPLFRPTSALSNASSSSSSARRQSLPVSASQAEEGRRSSQGGETRRKKKKRKTTHGAEGHRGSRLALGDGDWEDEPDPGYEAQDAHPLQSQSRSGAGTGNAVAGPSRLSARPATQPRTRHRNAEAGPSRPTPSHPGPRLSQPTATSSTQPHSTAHTSHKRPRAPISPASGPRHRRMGGPTLIPSPSSRPAKRPRMSAPSTLPSRLSLGGTTGLTADEPIELDLSESEGESGKMGPPMSLPEAPVLAGRSAGMMPGPEVRRAAPVQAVSSSQPPATVQAAPRARQSVPVPPLQASSQTAQPSPSVTTPSLVSTATAPISLSQPVLTTSSKAHAPRRPKPIQPRTSLPHIPTSTTIPSSTAPTAISTAPQPRLDDLLSQWQKDEAARKSRQDADVFSADYQRGGSSSSSRRALEKAERTRLIEEEEVAEGLFMAVAEESPEPIQQGPVVSQALSSAELSQKARKLIDELAAGRAASRPVSGTPSSSTSAPRPQAIPPSLSASQIKAAEEARLAAEAAQMERDAEAEAVALREIAEENEEERCELALTQLSQEAVDFDAEVAAEMGRRARRDAIQEESARIDEEERDLAAVREWDLRGAKMEAERLERERLKAAAAAKKEEERVRKEQAEARKLKEEEEKAEKAREAQKLKEEKERAAKKLREEKEERDRQKQIPVAKVAQPAGEHRQLQIAPPPSTAQQRPLVQGSTRAPAALHPTAAGSASVQKAPVRTEADQTSTRRQAQQEAYERAEAKRVAKAAADALVLEQRAKQAAEAKEQADAEAKSEEAAKAREKREAKAQAERKAAFLKKSQEEQTHASGVQAVNEWRRANRLRAEEEKRKEMREKTREEAEKERAEQEERDLQRALQLSQEQFYKAAERSVEPEKAKENAPDPAEAARKDQLEKEREEKEKAEKAKADAAAKATSEAENKRRAELVEERRAANLAAAAKEVEKSSGNTAVAEEEATRQLIEGFYWKLFDQEGGSSWTEAAVRHNVSRAMTGVRKWRETRIEALETAASAPPIQRISIPGGVDLAMVHIKLSSAAYKHAESLGHDQTEREETAEARCSRVAAENLAIGLVAAKLAVRDEAIGKAAQGLEGLRQRRAMASDAQRSLVAAVIESECGRSAEQQRLKEAKEKEAAEAAAKSAAEVKAVAEKKQREISTALQELVEAEYWKLYQSQGGKTWDEAAAQKACAQAVQTVLNWRKARIAEMEIKQHFDRAAAALYEPQVNRIIRSTGEGFERSVAVSQARAEAAAIVTRQRATETPSQRDARVAVERQVMGGEKWVRGLQATVDEKAVEMAAEKRDTLERRRGRATEAERAMFARVSAVPRTGGSQAPQSAAGTQPTGQTSATAAKPIEASHLAQPRPKPSSQRPTPQQVPQKSTAVPSSSAKGTSSSTTPAAASTIAPVPKPTVQQAKISNPPTLSRPKTAPVAPTQTSTPSNSAAAPGRLARIVTRQPEVVIPSAPTPLRTAAPPPTQQARVEPDLDPPFDPYDPNDGPSEPPSPIPTEEASVQPDPRPSRRSQKRLAQSSRSQEDDEPAPPVRQRRSRIIISDDEDAGSSSSARIPQRAKSKKVKKVASIVISDDEEGDEDDDHTPIGRPSTKSRRHEGRSSSIVPVHRMRRTAPPATEKGKGKAVAVIVMDDDDEEEEEEEEAVEEVEDDDYAPSVSQPISTPRRSQRPTQSTQSTDPKVRPRIAVIPPTQSSHGQSQPKETEEADRDEVDDLEPAKGRAAPVAAATQSGPGPLFQTPNSRSVLTSLPKSPHSSSSAITAVSSTKPHQAGSEVQRLLSLRKDDSVDQALHGVWSKVHRLAGSSAPPPPSPSTTAASRQPLQAVLRVSRGLGPSTSHTTVLSTTSTEVDIPRSDSTVPTEVSLQTATSATETRSEPSVGKVEQFLRSQAAASAVGKVLQDKFPRVEIRNGVSAATAKTTRASTRSLALPVFEEQRDDHDGEWETETEQDSRPASPARPRRTRGTRSALSVTTSEIPDSPSALGRRRSARNSGRTTSYNEANITEDFEALMRMLEDPSRGSRSRAPTEITETSPPPRPRPKPKPRSNYTNPPVSGPSSRSFMTTEQAAVPATADVDYDVDILRKYGLFCPTMKGRKNNKWTSWSTNVQPGTLMDLMWELDKLYMPGDRERPLLKRMEDEVIWGDMREVSDKRRFLNCCWARWSKERGPLRADLAGEFVHNFIDKYGEIMRFAGLDREVMDMIHILNKQGLVGFDTYLNACTYWNRHMRYYRKMKDRPLPLDDDWSDPEENMEKGRIRLKEFEEGGREYAEMVERKRARAEGRAPVLPKEKYVFGMDEEKDVGGML